VFDLRYHVASLAAVFVALIIGIVVGVGLADTGVTKKADLKKVQLERDNWKKAAADANARVAELNKTDEGFDEAYPAVMQDKLLGKRVAVLFVGPIDGGINKAIDTTLTDAGAGQAARIVSLSVPVNAQGLDNILFNKGPQFVKYFGNDKLESLGSALGAEFATGGQTPLWKALGRELVGERHGNTRQRVDAVVVARTVKPQQGDTARFLSGLYSGLASAGVPAVGVEKSDTKTSAVDIYRDGGLSSVDDVDLSTGRVALALLLAGGTPGKYGTAKDADAVLPRLGD
jgi:Copper transport outer membrane protein, MctB